MWIDFKGCELDLPTGLLGNSLKLSRNGNQPPIVATLCRLCSKSGIDRVGGIGILCRCSLYSCLCDTNKLVCINYRVSRGPFWASFEGVITAVFVA